MGFSKHGCAVGAMSIGLCLSLKPAAADVTITQQTTFDAASCQAFSSYSPGEWTRGIKRIVLAQGGARE